MQSVLSKKLMSLTELVSLLKELSYSDKLLLLHFLVAEFLKESGVVPLNAQDNAGQRIALRNRVKIGCSLGASKALRSIGRKFGEV
jgi:hypothetical protein